MESSFIHLTNNNYTDTSYLLSADQKNTSFSQTKTDKIKFIFSKAAECIKSAWQYTAYHATPLFETLKEKIKSIDKASVLNLPVFVADRLQQLISKVVYLFICALKRFSLHPVMHAKTHPLIDIFHTKNAKYNEIMDKLELMPKLKAQFESEYKKPEFANLTENKRIKAAIKAVVYTRMERLNSNEQALVNKTISDFNFSLENNRPSNDDEISVLKLAYALDLHGHLEREVTYCKIWESYEPTENTSSVYQLDDYRDKLEIGEIGYINGVSTTLETAKNDAKRLSTNVAEGLDITGIHNVSQGNANDIKLTIALHGGLLTTPAKLLLNQWMNFFITHPHDKYLQICYSQGAVHVNNALDTLDIELRKRICVIAIAPAILIPPQPECEVVHFVKSTDHFFKFAKHRSRFSFSQPDVISVDTNDSAHPHDPHGEKYTEAMQQYVTSYIRFNHLGLL